jgi:hypothetical protein
MERAQTMSLRLIVDDQVLLKANRVIHFKIKILEILAKFFQFIHFYFFL